MEPKVGRAVSDDRAFFRRFRRRARRFALGILKRVKAKLDGRDLTSIRERIELLRSGGGAHESAAPGQHRERLDVREHVERVIKEAVSVDNLAVMCAPGPGLAPASPSRLRRGGAVRRCRKAV